MLHYSENIGGEGNNAGQHISDIVNYGMYMFSVRIFTEYGLNPYPDYDDLADSPDTNNDGAGSGINFNFNGGCDTPQEHQHSVASWNDFFKLAAVPI